MSHTRFRVNLHSLVVWMSRNSLLETGTISEIYMTATGFEPTTTQLVEHTKPFSKTSQMIELCFEYLSVWCIWRYVLIMSHTRFSVNLHSVVAWMSRKSLLEIGATSTNKYSQHSSIISPVWLNVWVFVYEIRVVRVQILLRSLKFQIWRQFRARSFLKPRQL